MQSQKMKKFIPSIRVNLSLGAKLLTIAVLLLLVVLGVSFYQTNQTILANLEQEAIRELNAAAGIMAQQIEGDKNSALMVAASVANRPDVQRLTADNDRDGLQALLMPLFGQYREQHKVVHFNIIDERSVVILRLSAPDNFDDYVFFNSVVINTINTRSSSGGFEVDSGGLSMRGAAPIFYDGNFVGVIEIGVDYAQEFSNLMKQKTRADFLIWFYKPSTARFGVEFTGESIASPNEDFIYYSGTRTEDLRTESANLLRAFSSFDNIFAMYTEANQAQASLMVPILGSDATFYGVTEITKDYSQKLAADRLAAIYEQISILGISLVGLLAIGFAINFLVIRPLSKITHFANQITTEETVNELSLATGDEFEQVAGTLNQMAVAIGEKREELEKQVAQRTAQLQASNEVARVANAILDPNELIETVVTLISEKLDYYYAAIFIITEDGRWAELKSATGAAGEALKTRKHRLQVGGSSMVGTAISEKKARIALDVGETPVRFNNPLLPNTRSEIALPLIVGERVLGALDVQSISEADFNPEDISTLQGMVNQVAISLENARLFQEMNQSIEELRQTNSEFVTSAWRDRLKAGKLEHTSRPKSAFASETGDFQKIEVPLNLREQEIGQIALEINQEWEAEDQAWVESLATQVAISLENARLLEESQQAAMRERLSASIIQKVWSADNVDAIIQTAVRELARSLDASEVKIELKTD
ncbi:MAG: GAF domain-containing protein [Anaerolineales bacterium]